MAHGCCEGHFGKGYDQTCRLLSTAQPAWMLHKWVCLRIRYPQTMLQKMIFQYIPNEQILMRSITVTRYPSFSGIPQYHIVVDTVTHIIHHYIHFYPHDIPQVGWFSNQPCGC